MAEPLFDIVFRGDIVIGHNLEDVKARLGQLFKIGAARVESLFTGGAVVLKRRVDRPTAEKYKAVLGKAGAQVQLRPARPATESGSTTPPSVPRKTATSATPRETGAASRNGFSLAPAGSDLLAPSESKAVTAPELDLRGMSLRPMEGDLLEESEKPKPVETKVDVSGYELAAEGADLLEGFRRGDIPLPEVEADFEMAEAGADLLEPAYRREAEPVQVDVEHLKVLSPDETD